MSDDTFPALASARTPPPRSMNPTPGLSSTIDTDVLIVGAGPVGLLLAYQLRLFSLPAHPHAARPPDQRTFAPISVRIIEARPKDTQRAFGRAVTFWPRSMELLSALGLAEDIEQMCCAVRESAAFGFDGVEKQTGGAWSWLETIEDTRYTFSTGLRQKFVEDVFRSRLAELGVEVCAPHRFTGLDVDEDVPEGEMGRVLARVEKEGGEEYAVRCRYLIGCDGSRTKVRDAAGIGSVGSRTEEKWVRIDGLLKSTTMPRPRAYGALESVEHGNVLWIPIDHGATRIGYRLSAERLKRYEGSGMSQEEIFAGEAQEAVRPFAIEYAQVDWASIYSVGQRLAQTFWTKGCVFLAGDSCHTHSSGAGQGMNAGVNDAVNLGWKLALVLTGRANRQVLLETYDQERRPLAAKLIQYDEGISALIGGGVIPEIMRRKDADGSDITDPHRILGKVLMEARGYNTGLTLSYGEDAIVWGKSMPGEPTVPAPALPGHRAPDAKVLLPALWEERWLQTLMPNRAEFYLLCFVGSGVGAKALFKEAKEAMEDQFHGCPGNVPENGDVPDGGGVEAQRPTFPLRYITILPQRVDNAWHWLGFGPAGRVYYDADDGCAATRYGVARSTGTVFVIRPDGWIGARLDIGVPNLASEVCRYFQATFG